MKRIIIIGASSGLGLQMARDLARVGCRVGVAARRHEPLEQLRADYPGLVETATIDVTQPDAVDRFYNLIEALGGMDYLVYAAGAGFLDPDLDEPRITRMVEVNCLGLARITSAAYRYYRSTAADTPGHIAAITSVAGDQSIGIAAAYSASKAFGQRFLRALRQLAHQQQVNVRITDIRPGFVDTPFLGPEARDYPMVMPVKYAARKICVAVLRGLPVAYIDSRWGAVAALWRLIPSGIWADCCTLAPAAAR